MPANESRASPSLLERVGSASLIFSGTVVERGTSTVPAVPPNEKLVVVRLDRALRVDPVLGDLKGKMITVAAATPESLTPGQRAVFFTNSWIHGQGIAVREVEHVDVQEEDRVAAAVAELPQRHMLDRLQDAEVVVDAKIAKIDPPGFTFDQHDGLWAASHLQVNATLKGKTPQPPVFYFATGEWPPWNRTPRFEKGQAGIFMLHIPPPDTVRQGGTLPAGSLVAVDNADFQDESQAQRIKQLLAALK